MWGHYRAREPHVSCTWATRKLYVRGSPPPLIECYTWGHYHAHEPHMSCTWATRKLYVRGSPPPLIECYTWGHYLAREPHMSCTWATRELYVRGSPPPLIECYTWGHYLAREPHVSCTWGAPLHHWLNATREGITVHVSHTWLTCMHIAPLHLPKKVTKKQSVNHIGSSDEPPMSETFRKALKRILVYWSDIVWKSGGFWKLKPLSAGGYVSHT